MLQCCKVERWIVVLFYCLMVVLLKWLVPIAVGSWMVEGLNVKIKNRLRFWVANSA